MTPQRDSHEETLDPAEWASLRALIYRMADDMLDYTGGRRWWMPHRN